MSQQGWIVKKGRKHLHGFSTVGEKIVKPKWLDKREGALVFSRAQARVIAAALGAVSIAE